jgi:ribosomal protein L7/L12
MPVYNELQLSSYVDQIFKRLSNIEEQLAVLSQNAGVPYAHAAGDAPPEVLELVRAGDRMGAIRKYRELTGAGMQEASDLVESL